MGKVLAALLIIAAAALSAYYLLTGHRPHREDVARARGWKRHVLAATAIILALVSASAYAGEPAKADAAAPPAGEKPDRVADAWRGLRKAWREIDRYSPDALQAEQQADKKRQHAEALKILTAEGALPGKVAAVLTAGFHAVTDHVVLQPIVTESGGAKPVRVQCYVYEYVEPTSTNLENQPIGKLVAVLDQVERYVVTEKLTPETVNKLRTRIGRELQLIVMAANVDSGDTAKAVVEALVIGKPVSDPVPPHVQQAARVLMQLLTSDQPPVVAEPEKKQPSENKNDKGTQGKQE